MFALGAILLITTAATEPGVQSAPSAATPPAVQQKGADPAGAKLPTRDSPAQPSPRAGTTATTAAVKTPAHTERNESPQTSTRSSSAEPVPRASEPHRTNAEPRSKERATPESSM